MNNEITDRRREMEEYANAGGAPPQGHALVRATTGVPDRIMGAQPVAVYRDEQKILQKLTALAAAAGPGWFYRFPVKKKDGGQDWIEGASIKLANDVARIFGNNVNEIRELDVGDAWVFYARFTDIETGFSMERAYRQRKSQTSMRTRDADRQLDIAYQIGQSKAIRNAITNALQIYCDFAFEQARNSLVEKIGKDVAAWRERTLQGLANIPVEVHRAERVIGRASKDWLAPHIAQIIAMMKSIADGMATAEEVFPPVEDSTSSEAPRDNPTSSRTAEEGRPQGPDAEPVSGVKASVPAAADDGLEAAYARGAKWRSSGGQRKAVPPELRTQDKMREQIAWQAGFDGSPMPQFKSDHAEPETP